MNLARLNDYAPGSEWFEAMETYRSDGWIALRRAMDKEPGLAQVLDRWATWRYGLEQVTDTKAAWTVFERIRQEADQQQYYLTADIAGRAVELLTPKLDPDQLVRLARSIVRSTRLYSWSSWQMNSRGQFGMNASPWGLPTGAEEYVTGYMAGGRGEQRLAPGDYAVAHAVWMLAQELEAQDDTQPNIVERELVPPFLARHYHNLVLLRLAAQIGGPALDQYLLRQNWQAAPEDLPWGEKDRPNAVGEVNGWLYLLANLRSPTGRQFRQDNQPRLMEMADRLTQHMFSWSWDRSLQFLFLDLEAGPSSLARRYWPRFQEAATREKHDALSLQYQYLLRMEPLSTVDMYVQCWKESRGDPGQFDEALDNFTKSSVPYHKRERIYEALADYIEGDVRNVEAAYEPNEQKLRRDLLGHLGEKLRPITDEARARDLFIEIQAGSPKYLPANVAAWLTHSAPGHPLVRLLANAKEPSLRLLVMGALREYPTPANRAILQKLLQDNDEQVRTAAQAVAAALTTLKETPAAHLADKERRPATP